MYRKYVPIQRFISSVHKVIPKGKFYTDSIKNGQYILTNALGQISAELNFQNNLPHGKFLFYDQLSSDTMYYANYEKGVHIGSYLKRIEQNFEERGSYHANGKLNYYKQIVNLKPRQFDRYDTNGTTVEHWEYYDSGKLKQKSQYRDSIYENYNEKGALYYSSYPVDTLEGTKRFISKYYHDNGVLKSISYNYRGKNDSIYNTYFSSGKPQSTLLYKDGKRQGPFQMWKEDGTLTSSGQYLNDLADGTWITLQNGKLDTVNYLNGNVIAKPTAITCGCVDTNNLRINFANLLQHVLSHKELMSNYPSILSKIDSSVYNHLFYLSSNYDRGFFQADLLVFDELSFSYPASPQLKLVLNPCRKKRTPTKIPISLHYQESTKRFNDGKIYPDRVSLELLSGPLKSTDKDYRFYTVLLNAESIIVGENSISYVLDKKPEICATPGRIKDYIDVQSSWVEPIQSEQYGLDYKIEQLGLTDKEKNFLFGLYHDSTRFSLPYFVGTRKIMLSGTAQFVSSGNLVSGLLQIPCKLEDTDNFSTKDKNQNVVNFSAQILKTQLLKAGFSRVKTNFSENILTVHFFAE